MKKMKKKFLVISVLVILILSLGLGFAFAEEDHYIIKLSHGCTGTDPTVPLAERFKELVSIYTDNRVEIQIYPNNQLGSEQEVAQAVRLGSIEAELLYTGNLQPFAPSVGVLHLPYIFNNREEARKVIAAIIDDLNERMIKEAGVRALLYYEKGFRVLTNSKKPVTKIDDLKGLKIRVSKTNVTIETFKAWGIDPIPMAWAEVFTALQQGVIDGQENPYATIPAFKFDEVQKYVTEIHYQIWSGPLIINEKYFQGLPNDIQAALIRAGKEACEYVSWIVGINNEIAKKDIVEKGMVLLGPPEDEEIWREKAEATWPKFYDNIGGKEWVEKVIKIKEEALGN